MQQITKDKMKACKLFYFTQPRRGMIGGHLRLPGSFFGLLFFLLGVIIIQIEQLIISMFILLFNTNAMPISIPIKYEKALLFSISIQYFVLYSKYCIGIVNPYSSSLSWLILLLNMNIKIQCSIQKFFNEMSQWELE